MAIEVTVVRGSQMKVQAFRNGTAESELGDFSNGPVADGAVEPVQ